MSAEKFSQRHRSWSMEKSQEELAREVMDSLQKCQERLRIEVDGKVIHAEVEPEHLVEDLLAEFLWKQFPNYYVVLESSRGTFTSGRNIAGVLRMEEERKDLVEKLQRSI